MRLKLRFRIMRKIIEGLKKSLNKYYEIMKKIITICSSIEFTPKIIELKKELIDMGYEVLIPTTSLRIETWELSFEEFMEIKNSPDWDLWIKTSYEIDAIRWHAELIKKSDAILVVNETKREIDNYIWGNTFLEIWIAHILYKKIFIYNDIPEYSSRMHYIDEIKTVNPIILNWDLAKIKDFI